MHYAYTRSYGIKYAYGTEPRTEHMHANSYLLESVYRELSSRRTHGIL